MSTKKDKPKYEKCKYPVGAFSGITIDGLKVIAGVLRCNRWDCPACHPRLKAKLYKRILSGPIANADVKKYGIKFLTLTYGGTESREETTREKAYDEMSKAYHKMILALKKRYGHFHYFRVCELHKDGWPHFHVLLVGDNIAPKSLLPSIQALWCTKYGLGYVKLNKVDFNSAKHAINYMLKYITKDIKKVAPYKRIFTASVGAMLKTIKTEWQKIRVHMGFVQDRGIMEYSIDGQKMAIIEGKTYVNAGDRICDIPTHIDRYYRSFFEFFSGVRPTGLGPVIY